MTYDAASEGATSGGGGPGELPPWQNLLLTLAVVGGLYCYANGKVPSMPKREPKAPPPASADEVDEARRARLARFTGDGPSRSEVAFAQALSEADPSAAPLSSAPGGPWPSCWPRVVGVSCGAGSWRGRALWPVR